MANQAKFSSHINELRQKHRNLDKEINALGKYPDQAELMRLKRMKLKLKEEIRHKVLARWRKRHPLKLTASAQPSSGDVVTTKPTAIAAE
jgi:hypothetical protein